MFLKQVALNIADQLFILEQEQVRVKNVSMFFSKSFLCLFFNCANLPARKVHCGVKPPPLSFQIGILYPPVIHMLSALVHSQDLTDHDTVRDTQTLATYFLRSFGHREGSGSISPKPLAKSLSMAFMAASSSMPSALACS